MSKKRKRYDPGPALSPEEAARRFMEAPDTMVVRLSELVRSLELPLEELQADLQAGRLKAQMPPEYRDLRAALEADAIFVTGRDAYRWLAWKAGIEFQ